MLRFIHRLTLSEWRCATLRCRAQERCLLVRLSASAPSEWRHSTSRSTHILSRLRKSAVFNKAAAYGSGGESPFRQQCAAVRSLPHAKPQNFHRHYGVTTTKLSQRQSVAGNAQCRRYAAGGGPAVNTYNAQASVGSRRRCCRCAARGIARTNTARIHNMFRAVLYEHRPYAHTPQSSA